MDPTNDGMFLLFSFETKQIASSSSSSSNEYLGAERTGSLRLVSSRLVSSTHINVHTLDAVLLASFLPIERRC